MDKLEDTDQEVVASDEKTAKIDISKLKKKLEAETFKEGQPIPEKLRSRCKKNTYGGYSLKHDRFIYILDADYRVEVKRPDTDEESTVDEGEPVLLIPAEGVDEQDQTILFSSPGAAGKEGDIELEKGDQLPEHLRRQCEVDLSAGGGSRIKIGPYLYLLDNDFRVSAKMRVAYSEG